MRLIWTVIAAVSLLAVGLLLVATGGPEPAQATHGNVEVHVHDNFYHTKGAFLVSGATDHNLAKSACEKASPDAQCDTAIHVGDTITWVAPAPLAALLHTVTECIDNTFATCGAAVDANNPIGDSGTRTPPPDVAPSGWPYGPVQFNTVGTFYYNCTVHPDVMRGRVVVSAAPAATVTAAPTATPVKPPGTGGPADGAATPWVMLLAIAGGLTLIGVSGVTLRTTRRIWR